MRTVLEAISWLGLPLNFLVFLGFSHCRHLVAQGAARTLNLSMKHECGVWSRAMRADR